MTQEELKKELKELAKKYEQEKFEVYKKYALANNPYKIGDFVTDHVATIQVQKIGIYISDGVSSCTYTGIQYNKDGKISKKQDHTTAYQMNINKIINP